MKILGAIHSTKISGNFGPKLNGSVRSNRKSFEKTGPPFEVVLFSRSDRLEFWLNGSRPLFLFFTSEDIGVAMVTNIGLRPVLFKLHSPNGFFNIRLCRYIIFIFFIKSTRR